MHPATIFNEGGQGLPAGLAVLMAESGFNAPAPVRSAEAESGEGEQAQELPEAAEGVEQVTHRRIVVWRPPGGGGRNAIGLLEGRDRASGSHNHYRVSMQAEHCVE